MSVCTQAIVAAISAVRPVTTPTTPSAKGAALKSSAQRATRYTPAVTIVAAWISAETGVGPSIASGSQTCSGSWADLAAAATKSSSVIAVSVTEDISTPGGNKGGLNGASSEPAVFVATYCLLRISA